MDKKQDNSIEQSCFDFIASAGVDVNNPFLMLSYEQEQAVKDQLMAKIKSKEVDFKDIDWDFCKFTLERKIAMTADVTSIDELVDFDRSFGSETIVRHDGQSLGDLRNPLWLNFERQDFLDEKAPLRYFYLKPTQKLIDAFKEYTIDAGSRYLALSDNKDGSFSVTMKYDQILGTRNVAVFSKKGLAPLLKFLKKTSHELDLHAEKKAKLAQTPGMSTQPNA